MLCASDVVSDVGLVARFISPDMPYFSPCVNTSRLIWRAGVAGKSCDGRSSTAARVHSAILLLHRRLPVSVSPPSPPPPPHPASHPLPRYRGSVRPFVRPIVYLVDDGLTGWLAASIQRRTIPTSDCTSLSFHIEQLTVAAAAWNAGTRNISPRSARPVAMVTRCCFPPLARGWSGLQ